MAMDTETGRWRFCPACAHPVLDHPDIDIWGESPNDYDIKPDFRFDEVVCSRCERPWKACPCEPAWGNHENT